MALLKYIEQTYIVIKFASLTLTMLLSFAYSDKLGPYNRSILTFVFISTLIIVGILTSGTTLTLRLLNRELVRDEIVSFLSLSLFQFLIGLLLSTCSLLAYSELKISLDYKYILLGVLFYTLAHISIIFGEYFAYKNEFIKWAKFEVCQVIIQITVYFFLINLAPKLSTAVIVLLSFSISTMLIISIVFLTFPRKTLKLLKLGNLSKFWKISKQNILGSILIIAIRYIDRIILTIFFATEILAIYSIFLTLIYFFRFIPEYISKIIIAKNIHFNRIKSLRVYFVILVYFLLLNTLAIISRFIIENSLGSEWTLPIAICIFIGIQEFLHNCFLVINNFTMPSNKENLQINSTKLVLITVLVFAIYPIYSENLAGLVWSLSLAYLTAILYHVKCNSNE